MKIKIFLLIFIYAMLTWSCNTHVVVPSPVPSTSFTSMIAATELPPLKLTPSLTPTPVASITRSLFPTLSSKDREKKLGELLQTNDNCSKPCFWGISPNTSNFDDTVAFLKSLGSKGLEGLKDSTRYYNVVYSYRDDIIIGLAFTESNGRVGKFRASLDILQTSKVSSLDWLAFRPDSIIKTYGIPSSVKIGLGEGPNGLVIYQLLLTYDATNLNILYSPTDDAILPTSVLHTCPLAEHAMSKFDIWLGQAPQDLSSGMKEIEEVSPLTVEDFSKLVIDKKEKACFDITLSH